MNLRDKGVAAHWRTWLIGLAMLLLLLGGIRRHALHFSVTAKAAVSSYHLSSQRQSFDTDTASCIAPPRTFAFEPLPTVFSRVVPAQQVFLPSHPDGWHFNRPPPAL